METIVCAKSTGGSRKRKRQYDKIRFIKIAISRMKPGPAKRAVVIY
jgi:hypothetical protein